MTKPIEISLPEWAEIMRVLNVRECWGFGPEITPDAFSASVYGVKFNFKSGGPGYCGDLYVLLGDVLERPLMLIRRNGALTADL